MIAPQLVTYELRVNGHLDDHWARWLGDLTLTRRDDGTSTLTGPMADQAQLHGVLARLRDIGTTLLALRSLADTEGTEDTPARSHATPGANDEPHPTLRHTLTTQRLTLRAGTDADADVTFAYRRSESVGRWLTEVPTDLEGYRTTFCKPARLAATVIVERDAQVIGDFMVRVEDGWAQAEVTEQARAAQAELGWVLDPTYTGHGYATEAVRALLTYCFDELRVRRVTASCFLDNDASWRLMDRLGMRREMHAVRDSLHRSGRWLDTVTYALLADEWAPSG